MIRVTTRGGMVWVHTEGCAETPRALAGVQDSVWCVCCKGCLGCSVEQGVGWQGACWRQGNGHMAVAGIQDRYSGGLDGVAGSEKGEEPMKWRDIWEVGSAGLSPKPPLGKIILVCSTTCVNEIISKHLPTPPPNPTADWLRLFLVCP